MSEKRHTHTHTHTRTHTRTHFEANPNPASVFSYCQTDDEIKKHLLASKKTTAPASKAATPSRPGLKGIARPSNVSIAKPTARPPSSTASSSTAAAASGGGAGAGAGGRSVPKPTRSSQPPKPGSTRSLSRQSSAGKRGGAGRGEPALKRANSGTGAGGRGERERERECVCVCVCVCLCLLCAEFRCNCGKLTKSFKAFQGLWTNQTKQTTAPSSLVLVGEKEGSADGKKGRQCAQPRETGPCPTSIRVQEDELL